MSSEECTDRSFLSPESSPVDGEESLPAVAVDTEPPDETISASCDQAQSLSPPFADSHDGDQTLALNPPVADTQESGEKDVS